MSFDTFYLVLGGAFAVCVGVLLFLKPPSWRLFSGCEAVFLFFAFAYCITPESFEILLAGSAVCLLGATLFLRWRWVAAPSSGPQKKF